MKAKEFDKKFDENQNDIWTLLSAKSIAAAEKYRQDKKESNGGHVFVAR